MPSALTTTLGHRGCPPQGVRSPRLLLADRSKNLYPADIVVAEDVRGGTLEALLERDPDAYET